MLLVAALLTPSAAFAQGAPSEEPPPPPPVVPPPPPSPTETMGEPSPEAVRLFREGRELVDQSQWDAACAKFQASFDTAPTVAALLNLGLCHEKAGRTATSWRHYQRARVFAERSGDAERTAAARDAEQVLAPTLRRFTFDVARHHAGLELRVDGVALSEAEQAASYPVDAGEHRVEATAPGRRPFETRVAAPEPGQTRAIALPELAPDHAQDRLPPPVVAPAEPSMWSSPLRVTGLVLVSAGAVGIGIGAGFGGAALAAKDDTEALCAGDGDGNPFQCSTPEAIDARRTAEDRALVATLGISIGTASALAGVLALTWPLAKDDGTEQARTPRVVATPGGVGLRGEF